MSGKNARDTRTPNFRERRKGYDLIRWPTTPCRVCGQRIETCEALEFDGMCDQCEYKNTVADIKAAKGGGK